MHPQRQPAHPIHDLIRKRYSPRAFSDRPVEFDKLHSLFEAARWAASCFNEQPWSYLVALKQNSEDFARMLACLVPKNQQWAASAPVLMISVAQLQFAGNAKPNRHAFHDVGAASAFLTLQATALDLYVHQMAGFDVARARETYSVPATAEPVAAIAVGYLADLDALPEEQRRRELTPSARKPLADFIFSGTWGRTPEWLAK